VTLNMNATHRGKRLLGLGAAVLLMNSACRHTSPSSPITTASPQQPKQQIRVNSLSLLHQLLEQQRNVDKLLLIKKESTETHRLIKAIASASATGARRLESFAAKDASLRLDQMALPVGEIAVRDAIASTKTKELLTPFNPHFERNLLLTQVEALSYAWHLAKIAAVNEPAPARAQYLTALSDEMKQLHQQTVSLMEARTELAQPRRRL
jgi:hypothetical protein